MSDQLASSSIQNARPLVRFPLRTKITIPYLILSFILAVLAAYLITQVVVDNLQERFRKQLFEAGKISSQLIVDNESKLLETQRLLANSDGVAAAVEAQQPDQLRSLTLGIIANSQQEDVEFVNATGANILSIHHPPNSNPEQYAVSTGGETAFSDLQMVRDILELRNDSRGDKFADFLRTDLGDFLYVAGPLYDSQGTVVGTVLVGRSLPTLASDMRTKTFGQISFYDPSGRVIYSTLPFPHDLTADNVRQIVSTENTSSLTRQLTLAEISYAEVLGPWNVRGDHNLGVLGVALSQNAVVQTSTTSRWKIFLLVAAANFLIILVGISLANTITKPLLRLVQASALVAGGDLSVEVRPQSNDEISVLTESFNQMVASLSRSQNELIRSYDETLEGWAKALELRDKETQGHSERVTRLAVQLAEAMGMQGEALENARRGALLHDIGKMGTPDVILRKNGPLTPEEREIIQRHPQDAFNMLGHIDFLRGALDIPYCHHEKWDGTGYPRGLKGAEIPLSARVFAIVDVYDALSNDRPYRKAMPSEAVLEHLRSQSGLHFDPEVVRAFMKILSSEDTDADV
jgi:putative nucleotidyltransferase with HDIG domain